MEEKMKSTMMNGKSTGKSLMWMQMFISPTKGTNVVAMLSDDEFNELLGFLQVNDAEELEEDFPHEALFEYRAINGAPYKGLLYFGADEVEVDFKTLPEDHVIPEVIEAQKAFLFNRTMPKFRKKLFETANRNLTRMELEGVHSEMLQRLAKLVDVLVDGMTAEELEQSEWNKLKKRVDAAMNKG